MTTERMPSFMWGNSHKVHMVQLHSLLMRGLDFNTIFTLPVYAMGPFTSRVPFIPLTRHTNSELSTLPVDATHASSAENLTALTWLLWPLNLAEPAPLATQG